MSFDALTLSAVRDELEPRLVEARMQKLIFADELSLAVECFAPGAGRTNVLLSAEQDSGRIQRIPQLPVRGVDGDSPFSLLIRKHLRNARIRSVNQPRLERVFELDCEQRDSSGRVYRVSLIVEVMGRRSNLVLVGEDGVILDAARRSPPSRNPRRPVLPHLPYVAPPPQARLFPEDVSASSLAAGAAAAGPGQGLGLGLGLGKYLASVLAGLSPLAGRELAFRATGAVDTPLGAVDWDALAPLARDFMRMALTHAWQPCIAVEDGHPVAFAPYRLSHLAAAGAEIEPFASMSDALQTYYARLAEVGPARRGDALAAERKSLLAPIERAAASTAKRVAALQHQLSAGRDQREPLRRAGEALLTYQADAPPGSSELVVDGERFDLDPRLSAVDNAQAYFARYRKAREAEERVPELLEHARNTAVHLDELKTLVDVADDMNAVRALRREVGSAISAASSARAHQPAEGSNAARSNANLHANRKKPEGKSAPFRRMALGEGWEALVGTSAAGNAAVTFDLGQPDDLWLHARGMPGAHVILRTHGATPPESVVERAAQIAAWHSAARLSGAAEVDVAQRRHVRKIPNAPPGLVRYANERTVRVPPRA